MFPKSYFSKQIILRIIYTATIVFLFLISLYIIGRNIFVSNSEAYFSFEDYLFETEYTPLPEDTLYSLGELAFNLEEFTPTLGEPAPSSEEPPSSSEGNVPSALEIHEPEEIDASTMPKERTPPWLEPDFLPLTDELDDILSRHGYNISVYYKNLDSGFVYRHNADRVYYAASVTKAFYALYLFQLAEQGILCLDTEHTFTYADFMDGSGIIRYRYPVGTSFTLRELLRLNVSYSDNIATLILVREHGAEGFRQFLTDLGGNLYQMGWGIMDFHMNAEEAGIFLQEVHRYIEEGSEYALALKSDLLNNQYPFIVSDYPIASKTGWTSFYAWHDAAIVYATSPYILVIFTARGGWTDTDFQDFEEISMAFQHFNTKWFEEH